MYVKVFVFVYFLSWLAKKNDTYSLQVSAFYSFHVINGKGIITGKNAPKCIELKPIVNE